MFEQPFHVSAGRKFSASEKTDAEELVKEWHQHGQEKIEGEREKTAEELLFIERFNGYLRELYLSLGMKQGTSIDATQIHILPSDAYQKIRGQSAVDSCSAYGSKENVVMMRDTDDKEAMFYNMAHESIHAVSFHSFRAETKPQQPKVYRMAGYSFRNPKTRDMYFRGFNEALTERTAREILREHSEDMRATFNIPMTYEEAITGNQSRYSDYLQVLDELATHIADNSQETPGAVFARFQKGMFTGNMMALRDVERTLGKGSLRLLANMPDGFMARWSELRPKLLEFITTKDFNVRTQLQSELADLLPVSERELYDRRLSVGFADDTENE